MSKTFTRRTIFESVVSGRMQVNYYDCTHYHSVMSQDDKKRRVVMQPLRRCLSQRVNATYATIILISPLFFDASNTVTRSFAINSVRRGVDPRRLQQVLGHTNSNTTAVYLQFSYRDLQDVYANVPF